MLERLVFGKFLAITDGSLSLQFFCHEMPFECIYDLCKWNLLYNSSHISTVALFSDMHGIIDVFNSNYGKAG